MLTFTYCRKRQVEVCILNYKTNARGFASIANLSLVSSSGTISHCHIMLTSIYLYYPIVPCHEIRKQSSFW